MKTISLTTLGVVVLWSVALGLLAVDTFDGGGMTEIGRWGIFFTGAAATVSVVAALHRARDIVLEVLTWGIMRHEHSAQVDNARTNVRKIR